MSQDDFSTLCRLLYQLIVLLISVWQIVSKYLQRKEVKPLWQSQDTTCPSEVRSKSEE